MFANMVMKGRVARAVEDLDDNTLKAIANSAVPAEFAVPDGVMAVPDGVMKDWNP